MNGTRPPVRRNTRGRARPRGRVAAAAVLVAAPVLLCACDGPQSALQTAGRDAERIAALFGWMAAGAAVIWIGMVGLAAYAIRGEREAHDQRAARALILGGGVVFPVVVLTVLLLYGLPLTSDLLALPPPGGMTIRVTGEQWWWRVRYELPDGQSIEMANEIRLPVGRRIEIRLEAAEVIHAFWVPSIAGKIDMVPGRVNRLALEPTRTGTFRGACAEYCGTSHARMNFDVVVMEEEPFADWLRRQQLPAPEPADARAAAGRTAFLANGCGACHTIRGTDADGVIGPDLTHVGSRVSLAAGTLPNEPSQFERWIAHTDAIKPGVHMPAFGMLPEEDLAALGAYLGGLP